MHKAQKKANNNSEQHSS